MNKTPKKEASMEVAMLKTYRPEKGDTLKKGMITTMPAALAKKLIKAGIASADAAV